IDLMFSFSLPARKAVWNKDVSLLPTVPRRRTLSIFPQDANSASSFFLVNSFGRLPTNTVRFLSSTIAGSCRFFCTSPMTVGTSTNPL
ncbi:hypothetical protein PENTCL1PPCAC_19815, partial [Pristionchus entomophagus]